jgi:hypothetical protein
LERLMAKRARFLSGPVGLCLCALALVVACRKLYSLHPLFADADAVLDPRLLGSWTLDSTESGARWVFLRIDSTSRSYTLALTDSATARVLPGIDISSLLQDSATMARVRRDPSLRARRTRDSAAVYRLMSDSAGSRVFEVRLGRLAGVLFLDIKAGPLYGDSRFPHELLLPVHWFWRASLQADRLQVTPLDDDWLGRMIDSGTVRIAHERVDGSDLVLTAPTDELQRLIARYAQDTLAFPRKNAIQLRR